jgi:outer membrane protein assembly factor BamE
MNKWLLVFFALMVSGCSSWVYKIDITQGNFLNQDDVDKLRVEMTKEQVEYVLGQALLQNPFKEDRWHYVFTRKSGVTEETYRKELIVEFDQQGLLKTISGDFEQPADFNTPLDAQ